MQSYEKQVDGRIIYANGFGGITTIEPNNHSAADLEEARRSNAEMDTKLHHW